MFFAESGSLVVTELRVPAPVQIFICKSCPAGAENNVLNCELASYVSDTST